MKTIITLLLTLFFSFNVFTQTTLPPPPLPGEKHDAYEKRKKELKKAQEKAAKTVRTLGSGTVDTPEKSVDGEMLLSPSMTRPVYVSRTNPTAVTRTYTIDGTDYKQVTHNGKTITFSHFFWRGYVCFTVSVTNLSDTTEFLVDPEEAFMEYTQSSEMLPDFKLFTKQFSANPEKIADKLENRARWANAFRAFGAGMATTTVTAQTNGTANVYGSNGNSANGTYSSTTTVTAPDVAAQQRAARINAENSQRAQTEGGSVVDIAFKRNTIFPLSTVTGIIYFKNPKFTRNLIVFPIDGYQYTLFYQEDKK